MSWRVLLAVAAVMLPFASMRARSQAASPQVWQAAWIAAPWSTERDGAELDGSRPMPIFRREFAVRGNVAKAELRIVGLGQWTASMDGAELMPPGLHGSWTDYRKRVEYRSIDLTSRMTPGRHVLGVMLGNGMYNVQRTKGRYTKFEGSFGVPMLTAELRVRYRDGRTEAISTDGTWNVARGPVVFSSTYGGEDFDARRVQSGWDRAGFRESDGWEHAKVVAGPGGMVEPAIEPDVVTAGEYRVIKQTTPAPGKVVYDLGQNFAGIVRLKVRGPAGAVLKLTPGELLNADGTVSQASSGRGMWWSYTLRGGAPEEWRPLFSYYGFRYVQAEWSVPKDATEQPKLLNVAGEQLHSDSAAAGHFESSNEMLNRIHHLILAAMHNNEVSLFTDCPHREKLGWLEQTHLVADGLLFNDDLEALYRETDRNMAEAQDATGMVPTIAPQYTKFGPKYAVYDDSPEWGSAVVLAPWAAYRFYGDKGELERQYPAMEAWVRYLESRAEKGIVSYGLGDWYDIGPGAPGFSKNTTTGVTGTLILIECAQVMQRIAELLDKHRDVAGYRDLASAETAAFNARFWDAQHGWYDRGSQTANAMPLALGVVPQERRAAVLAHVVEDIHAHDDHTTSGEVGYPYLLRALHESGRDDVVMAMLMRKDPPSYGGQLAAGATALTESWDANPKNSQDHFMLGGAEEWLYRVLGGIDLDLSRSAVDQWLTIRPAVVNSVNEVRTSYRSVLGNITVERREAGAMMDFDITVPVRATVVLPLSFEGQRVLLEERGRLRLARTVRQDARTATFEVAAGTYRFRMAPARE